MKKSTNRQLVYLFIGLIGLKSLVAFGADTSFSGSILIKGPSPWIDVKAAPYLAKGDGTIDDTAAIQAAINAAGPGGTVFFPPGRYLISSSLKDKNISTNAQNRNLELRGAGSAGWGGVTPMSISSIITKTSIGNVLDFGTSGPGNPWGPQINHLGFEDARPDAIQNAPLNAIKITNAYHIQMQDVSCEDFKLGACITLNAQTPGDDVQYGTFIDIKSRKTKTGFEALGQVSQFVLLGGHFTAPDDPTNSIGIHIKQPANVAPGTGHADTVQIINTALESFAIAIKLFNADAVRIGARLENTNNQGTAISIDGSEAAHKSDGNLIMGTVIGGFQVGIDLGPNAQRTQIIGNSMVNVSSQINVNPAAEADTIIIGAGTVGIGTGTGGARWTTGSTYPPLNNVPICSNGSLYSRTDTGKLYVCETINGVANWVPK
jgi:Pectate lyase superfamily protein